MGLYDEMLDRKASEDNSSGSGIYFGIVKENWNEKELGKVKVEIIGYSEGKNVTAWIPVITPYAGKQFGLYLLPEIGSKVAVCFYKGDVDSPIVIGGFWDKDDTIPDQTAAEKNINKVLITKGGSQIRISDEEGKEKIQIQTPGKLEIMLDDENQSIAVKDEKGENAVVVDSKNGELKLTAAKKIICSVGGKDMFVLDGKADSAAAEAGKIDMNASQTIKIKGQTVNVEGNSMNLKTQNGKMEGSMLEIKGSGSLKVESSGILQAKGAMVKIN